MWRHLLAACAAVVLVSSCGGHLAAPAVRAGDAGDSGESDGLTAGRKLVRTVELDITVDDPVRTREDVHRIAAANGGYLARTEMESGTRSEGGRLVVRVPADALDAVVDQIRALAVHIRRELQEVKDVTEQSIDLDARLSALSATEKELLALLTESRERMSGVDDIMAIHRELTGIRSEIEKREGERKALAELVAFATIRLSLRPDSPSGFLTSSWRPIAFAGECLDVLVQVLKLLGYTLIFLIVTGVPIALLIGVPIWATIRIVRRRGAAR